jgi:hypothetical protein
MSEFVSTIKNTCLEAITESEKSRIASKYDGLTYDISRWLDKAKFDQKLLSLAQKGEYYSFQEFDLGSFNTVMGQHLTECPMDEFKQVFEQRFPGISCDISRLLSCRYYINILSDAEMRTAKTKAQPKIETSFNK